MMVLIWLQFRIGYKVKVLLHIITPIFHVKGNVVNVNVMLDSKVVDSSDQHIKRCVSVKIVYFAATVDGILSFFYQFVKSIFRHLKLELLTQFQASKDEK